MEGWLMPRSLFLAFLLRLFRMAAELFASAVSVSTQLTDEQSTRKQAGCLFDQYANSIFRLAFSYLHNKSDAEDILQETLMRYIESAPVFLNKTHEKAWLLRVAANLSKNQIKRNKIRETDELMEELLADEKEDLAFVWEAVKQLPEHYREAIHLFYQEGYSTREIAGILNRKEATVRSDLSRGREKLQEILKGAYDFE